MADVEGMTLDEVEATLVKLRERRRLLKQTGKASERKIGTLQRRRERLMGKVREIDHQIGVLRSQSGPAPIIRRRGRRPKVAAE